MARFTRRNNRVGPAQHVDRGGPRNSGAVQALSGAFFALICAL